MLTEQFIQNTRQTITGCRHLPLGRRLYGHQTGVRPGFVERIAGFDPTGNVSKATSSVDKVTQAPLGIIAKATSAIREKISPVKNAEGTAGVVLTNVDNGLEIVGEKVADMQADNAQRAADREAAQEARDKAAEETNRTAANLKEAVFIKANADAGAN